MTLYILGQGGHASSIFDAVNKKKIDVSCVNDAFLSTVLATRQFSVTKDKWILGFGNLTQRRKKIDLMSGRNITYGTVIHSTAVISPSSVIGEGVFIGANVYIGPNAVIKDHCIINTHAVVEHDCQIGKNVHISVNSTLCGNVHILNDTFLGAGSVVIPKIVIGSNAYIGAGIKVGFNISSRCFYDGQNLPILRRSFTNL